ncbi:DUF3429 domain-containing protein [Albimonas sp. CAU 1670]|uniref:DUF3429 domain-containing protein n=1 Tax=Albimonas sp. CAU 1670 TaxID=3032599 RepID=UPI0023DC4B89|nr:DUF3429 domain-containing protein [Albimonas sp. CAU 1670]MDF2235525.1 DUF3429 domain-containing protein [Albimonas sp. CAU 1670]
MPSSELSFRPLQAPIPALAVGLVAVAPFVVLLLLALTSEIGGADRARYLMGVWGAILLAFHGGCRWGFAAAGLGEGATWWTLGVGVAPALLGFLALGIGGRAMLWIEAPAFIAVFAADVSLARVGGAPSWWPGLILPLLAICTLCTMIGAVS